MRLQALQTGRRVIRFAAGLTVFGLLAWLGWNGANTRQELEAAGTARLLKELGCDLGQGWLFGRPIPAKTMAELLSAAGLLVPA